MRRGTTAESLKKAAEDRRQTQQTVSPEAEYLLSLNPDEVEDLFVDDGEGGSMPMFVFGLHSPFDSVRRHFPGT